MNEQQAAEMLNLLREMNIEMKALRDGMSRIETKMDVGFANVRTEVMKLGDQLTEGFDHVLMTHDEHHAALDERVKKIEKTFDAWAAQ